MSRRPRAGEAGKKVTFRAVTAEIEQWARAAEAEECKSLSEWIVRTLNSRSGQIVPR